MATYFGGLNPIRISGAVFSNTASLVNGGTVTVHTAPANGYSILKVSFQVNATTGTVQLQIGGISFAQIDLNVPANSINPNGIYGVFGNSVSSALAGVSGSIICFGEFHVGPSQSVVFVNSSGGTLNNVVASGVTFING